MHFPSALLLSLLFAPPPPTHDYEQLLETIEQLNEGINVGEPRRAELLEALAVLPQYTARLAADEAARDIQTRARLNLARSYLTAGDQQRASGVMDEVIRSTIGEALPVDEFGPSLTALHTERLAALEQKGRASIVVTCQVECRVHVNERSAGREIKDLYLGVYRIVVVADDDMGVAKPLVARISLSGANATSTIDFKPFPDGTVTPAKDVKRSNSSRVMPREAEIAVLMFGVAAAVIGGASLGLNHDRANTARVVAGSAIVAAGGVGLLVGGISLAVDEVRLGRARGRQAMVAWTINF